MRLSSLGVNKGVVKAYLQTADIFNRIEFLRELGGVLVSVSSIAVENRNYEKSRKLYMETKNIAQSTNVSSAKSCIAPKVWINWSMLHQEVFETAYNISYKCAN